MAPGKGRKESSIQVSLLLGEIYSFIIPPLASFLAGDTCKLISSLCYLVRIIMLQIQELLLYSFCVRISRYRKVLTVEGRKQRYNQLHQLKR